MTEIVDVHLDKHIDLKELLHARGQINDFSKLKIIDGKIHTFIYQQDGSKQEMIYEDTFRNRCFVSFLQIHNRP